MENLVFVESKEVLTDSLTVAKMFKKEHWNVTADIEKVVERLQDSSFIEEAEEMGINLDTLKFQGISYKDSMNRSQEKYVLNFDAFMLVTMGYTTAKAMLVKVRYINEFNKMQDMLKEQQVFKTPTNLKDALLLSVQLLEQKEALEAHNVELSQELAIAAPKATYYDMILSSDTLVTTKLVAKDYGISSAQKLNQMLKDAGIQYKEGRLWYIKAKYANEGYMKADTSRDGYITNKWTQKGRIFLHDFLTERGYKPNHIEDEE
jgi:Rha family phage regulatory protein